MLHVYVCNISAHSLVNFCTAPKCVTASMLVCEFCIFLTLAYVCVCVFLYVRVHMCEVGRLCIHCSIAIQSVMLPTFVDG